jgi:hypothetical protein
MVQKRDRTCSKTIINVQLCCTENSIIYLLMSKTQRDDGCQWIKPFSLLLHSGFEIIYFTYCIFYYDCSVFRLYSVERRGD